MTDLPQQVYDTVARHIIAQKTAAVSGYTCRYRTPHGRKCAIGCLIPDDMYDPRMEGYGIRHFMQEFPGVLPPVDSDLLEALQSAHDINLGHHSFSDWARRMQIIATKWELDSAIIRTHLENSNDTP